ncbi:MAG: major capsid protein [Treponema sp.]|jgi:hypothetical protein|nr:major capsid protein [Treponema sp.]
MAVQTLTSQLKIFFEERPALLMDFVNTFFRETRTFASKEIPVDRLAPKNILAGYRAPGAAADILAYQAGNGTVYHAPSISLATSVSEELANSATVGMEPNSPANEQLLRKYANIQTQQADAIYNQIAKQAADVLLYGKFDLLDGLGKTARAPIDFERDASLFENNKSYKANPTEQIEAAFSKLQNKNFPKIGVFALVGDTVLARLMQDAKFASLLKLQGLNAGRVWVSADNRVVAMVYTGMLAGLPVPVTLCNFSAAYEDAEGNVNSYIPDKAVVVGSFASIRIQAYGGIFIADTANNTGQIYEGQIITDRFVSKNPDEVVIRTQSAPLLIPGEVNHTSTVISAD